MWVTMLPRMVRMARMARMARMVEMVEMVGEGWRGCCCGLCIWLHR